MKVLCQHPLLNEGLFTWAEGKQLVFARFFFWRSGDGDQRSLRGLYRAFLFEVLRQCPDFTNKLFSGHCYGNYVAKNILEGASFRISELQEAMSIIVSQHQFPARRFCFFIDGLDEFEGDSTDHWELAQYLDQWASSVDVKICVSSRPHTEFLEAFDSRLRINLHDLTKADMQHYVQSVLGQEPNVDLTEEDFNSIASDIVDRSDGVFLWVRLVLRSLLEGLRYRCSYPVLREKLEKLPQGMEPLIKSILSSIHPDDRKKSDRLLFMAASYEPLNALMYTWFDDLEEPDFPFNRPIQAYSDETIQRRFKTLTFQLDKFSNGLLEQSRRSS